MTDPKTSPLRSVTIYFSSLRSCLATIRDDCSFFVYNLSLKNSK